MPTRLVWMNGDGSAERVVVVGLGGEVDHGVVLGHQRVDDLGVGDVAHDQPTRSAGRPSSASVLAA